MEVTYEAKTSLNNTGDSQLVLKLLGECVRISESITGWSTSNGAYLSL